MDLFFSSLGAKLIPSWYDQEKEQNKEIKRIYKNYLENDLKITSIPVFSNDSYLSSTFELDLNIIVQINEIVNISLPSSRRINFDQINSTISNNNHTDTFKMILSDGFNQFIGISKGNFPEISPQILPGYKIKILKGTKAKYGIFFLENDKTEFIGGLSTDLCQQRKKLLIYNPGEFSKQNYRAYVQNTFEKPSNHDINNQSDSAHKSKSKMKTGNIQEKQDNITKTNIHKLSLNIVPLMNSHQFKQANDNNQNASQGKHEKDFLNNKTIHSKKQKNIFDPQSCSSYSSDIEIIEEIKSSSHQQVKRTNFLSDDDFDDQILDICDDIPIENPNKPSHSFLSDSGNISDEEDVFVNEENNSPNTFIEKHHNNQMSLKNTDKVENSQFQETFQNDHNQMSNLSVFRSFNENIHKKWNNTQNSVFLSQNNDKLNDGYAKSMSETENLRVIMEITELHNKKIPLVPEVFFVNGYVTDCGELKIIRRGNQLFFSMDCSVSTLKSSTKVAYVKISSKSLENLLSSSPEEWIRLSDDEQEYRLGKCVKDLKNLSSPLLVIDSCNNSISNRYFICLEKLY
ncbi:hypothetical protein TRFO_01620 [Tritrichomonas foetus]|uniref:RecQ-mediated genome instability protein 1 n=1 Tax=Tritrichomonas foetus TaxID=1144522 RepID=A0A1J4JU66_9EUKA|nr:hypothetical protein TRFO_01620 [Tritrichomonas foetus]|eukprot:OHT01060.1 hypothetical protein TRFO_01620 [Tritrichomonas foetus]